MRCMSSPLSEVLHELSGVARYELAPVFQALTCYTHLTPANRAKRVGMDLTRLSPASQGTILFMLLFQQRLHDSVIGFHDLV